VTNNAVENKKKKKVREKKKWCFKCFW